MNIQINTRTITLSLILALFGFSQQSVQADYRLALSLPKKYNGELVVGFYDPWSVKAQVDGTLWVSDQSGIYHIGTDRHIINRIAEDTKSYYNSRDLVIAPDGSVWFRGDRNFYHYAATGQLIAHNLPKIVQPDAFDIASDGSFWISEEVSGKKELIHISAEGVVITRVPFNDIGINDTYYKMVLASDHNGGLWIVDHASKRCIKHFDAAVKLIGTMGLCAQKKDYLQIAKIAPSLDGRMWLLENGRLIHLSSAGEVMTDIEEKDTEGFSVIADGLLVVGKSFLKRFASDGSIVKRYGFNDVIQSEEEDLALNNILIFKIFGASQTACGQLVDDNSNWFSMYISGQALGGFTYAWLHLNENGRLIETFNCAEPILDSSKKIMTADGGFWEIKVEEVVISPGPLIWPGSTTRKKYLVHTDAKGKETASFYLGSVYSSSHAYAVTPDGNLLIDYPSPKVLTLFDPNSKVIGKLDPKLIGGEAFGTVASIEIANNGTLWVADRDKFNTFRVQKFVPHTHQLDIPAEYDDKNALLYVNDVAVGDKHYSAILKHEKNQYHLLALNPALASYTSAPSFNAADNLLTVPLAKAFGQDYEAVFKWVKQDTFELQSATLR